MSRPTGFKKSGGFLNNVDGLFQEYQFTTEFPGADDKPAKAGRKSDFTPLYGVITVLVDGADTPSETTLFVGSADDFEISEDGHSLTPATEGASIRESSDWAKLVGSIVGAGFPAPLTEEFYSDSPEYPVSFTTLLDRRYRFAQVKDVEATAKKGQRKGKDGKLYDRTNLVVNKVYDITAKSAGVAAKPAAVAGKVVASKPVVASKAVAAPKATAKAAPAVNITEIADETLVTILQANEGSIAKAKIPVKIANTLDKNHPQREEVRRLIYSDEYLSDAAERGLITYDQSSKAQTISLAE